MKRAIEMAAAMMGIAALTSCGMFYSKVGDRPGEDTSQSGKVSIADVAVTEYEFGGEAPAYNNALSYSIAVDTAPQSADLAFGHEFSFAGKTNPAQKVTGRLIFKPALTTGEGKDAVGHTAMVLLQTEGVTITNKACIKTPGTSDTPAFGLDAMDSYTCMLPGNWLPGKAYQVGMVNAEADGLAIKITGEGFENDKGYLKLESLQGMQMTRTMKAFTRALKAFGTCAALPSSRVSFGLPKLDGSAGQTVGDSIPIPACRDAITVECTPTGCRHVVNAGDETPL